MAQNHNKNMNKLYVKILKFMNFENNTRSNFNWQQQKITVTRLLCKFTCYIYIVLIICSLGFINAIIIIYFQREMFIPIKSSFQSSQQQKINIEQISPNIILHDTIKRFQNFYHKSDLQRLVQIPTAERTKHTLKKIRNQLKQMHCFKSSLQLQQQIRKDSQEIIKRDNQILTNVIAMYAKTNYAKKGTVLQATGSYRENIKILIRGNAGVYQPIGNKSFKYCYQKNMKHELRFQDVNLLVNQIGQHKSDQKINNKEQNIGCQSVEKNFAGIFHPEKPNGSINERSIKERLKNRQGNIFHQIECDQLIRGVSSMALNEQGYENINFKELKHIILQDKQISQKQGLKLLTWSNINSTISPHKLTKKIQNWGNLIASLKNTKISNQKQKYQISVVCLTDCVYLQIDFNIFKQILVLINNDQQKPYIRALLRKFQNMQYYEAKLYVKKLTMIDKKKMYKRETYKNVVKQKYGEAINLQSQKGLKQYAQQNQNDFPVSIATSLKKTFTNIILQQDQKVNQKILKKAIEQKQRKNLQEQSNQKQNNDYSKQFQNENNNLHQIQEQEEDDQINTEEDLNKKNTDFLSQDVSNKSYEIPFQKQIYFIVQGEVTLIIDQVCAYRVSQDLNANLKRSSLPKSLLKLYSGDMFGFETIGNQKQYNLRYQVKMNSKILKMSTKIICKHLDSIQNFANQLSFIKDQRNSLLKSLLSKIQNSIERNLIKKYIFRDGYKSQSNSKINQNIKRTRFSDPEASRISKITKGSRQSKLTIIQPLRSSNITQTTPSIKNQVKEVVKDIQQFNQTFIEKKPEIREIQYIGPKSFQILQESLASKISKQKMVISNRKITLDLLKQFDVGVDFTEEIQEISGSPVLKKYIEMRDKNGQLLRKKSIPQIGSKRYIQNIVMRKIGILNQEQIVKHNLKVVKNRKSNYKFDDLKKQRKQFIRLSKISKSLPRLKLDSFYAKSKNKVFNSGRASMNYIY